MARSKWKNSFIKKSLLKKIVTDIKYIRENKQKKKVIPHIKTKSRGSTILPIFSGSFVSVYNGKNFIKIKITKEMVGYKFGEFIPTRKKFFYKKSKNK